MMSLATSCDITRHHAIRSGSGSGAGGIRCHLTEGVAEERRGGGSGSGRWAGVGSVRGSPYTTVTTAGVANLYLQNIWKFHGLLQKVGSDHGPQFVTTFMKELYQLLGIKAATSTTYHLQTNGQTE